MARLIRTEKEVEGRYEEVWLVVEEDALEQWPAGPLDVVGRPAPRDRRARARARRGRLHRRPPAARDAAHGGAALAARARARHAGSTSRPRSRRPACTRRSGRATSTLLVDECGYQGAAGRRRLRRHARAGTRGARARSRSSGRCSSRCSTPTRRSRAAQLLGEPRVRERGDVERGLAEADVVVEASSARRSCCTTRWRRTRRSCSGSATRSRSTSRRSTSGASATRSRRRSACRPTRCASSATSWAAASARRTAPDDYTFIAAELAKRTGRPVRCALTRREENLAAGNRNATIQRLTSARAADGTLTALGGDYVNAVGWGGWSSPVEGPMQMLYACPNVQTTTYGGEAQPAADEGVPRARASSRARSGSRPARRARGEARPRPARAAPPQPRRARPQPTTARTAARTCSSATAAPSRTGSGGTRCARARPTSSSAASAWRRRSGTAAAARRATRGCASARTAARPSSPRCRTSAPARRRRWRRSRPRSSASRSST